MLDNNDFHLLVRTPRNAMFSEGMYLEYALKKKRERRNESEAERLRWREGSEWLFMVTWVLNE